MNNEFKGFLQDLITIYQEKYNDSLATRENEDEQTKSFKLGSNFAYYDALNIISSQLKAFGYDDIEFGQIVPELGQRP